MKIMKALAILALVLGLSVPSFAQTTTTQTVLSAAITSLTQSTITVASATGFTAGTTAVFIDREYMLVRGVSGTTITVIRAQGGTRAQLHPANTVAYVGPTGASGPFVSTEGTVREPGPGGSCTASNALYNPIININTGNIYSCREGRWISVGLTSFDYLVPWESIDTNADYTALLTDTWINFTDFQAARTVTLPSISGIRGKRIIITAGDNVTTATITATAVQGQLFASNASLSVSQTGAGATIRLLSTGTGWVTW